MTDFPRYTQGGIGPKSRPLTFAHINRITSATAKVEAMAEGGSGRAGHRRSFFASLAEAVSTLDGRAVWSWSQVGVTDAGDQLASVQGLIASDLFQDGNGLAVEMGSGSVPGDIVLIHELVCFDGKRRYAFSKGGGSSGTFVLTISTFTEIGEFAWQYNVTEGLLDPAGNVVQSGNAGILYNMYEKTPFGHGQDLSFGTGTLTPGPLEGFVWGGLMYADDDIRVYACDTPNPMVPQCAEVEPGQGGGFAAPQQSYGKSPYAILVGGI